jgi:hypothetical protein
VSRWITIGTLGGLLGPPVSHVGFATPLEDGMGIAEAVTSGFRVLPVSETLQQLADEGATAWRYPLEQELTEEQIRKLAILVTAWIGTPYDFTDVLYARTLGFGWVRHLAGALGTLPPYIDNEKLFCSESLAIELNHTNVVCPPFRHPSHWSPSCIVWWLRLHSVIRPAELLMKAGEMVR